MKLARLSSLSSALLKTSLLMAKQCSAQNNQLAIPPPNYNVLQGGTGNQISFNISTNALAFYVTFYLTNSLFLVLQIGEYKTNNGRIYYITFYMQ